MPRLFKVRTSAINNSVTYCVDAPVGLGCPNDREDVLLVQHLLRIAWNDVHPQKAFAPRGKRKR